MTHESPKPNIIQSDSKSAVASGFPYALVFRWLVGALLLIDGGFTAYSYLVNWHELMEKTVIDQMYNPVPPFLMALLRVAAGVCIFKASRWAVVLLGLNFLAFIILHLVFLGMSFHRDTVFVIGFQGVILWYVLNEWAQGRLR